MITVGRRSDRRGAWTRILGWGLALWALSAVVTYATANVLLVPTLVLLGSFLVPVTFVAWAFDRARTDEITVQLLFRMFVIGGVLGVLGASLAESYLLRPSWWMFFGVGFIEEAAKLLALVLCARHLRTRSARDGAVLGATVGLGFAAFESAGYALVASFTVHGVSLVDLVSTELMRGLLTPFGHGVWTAIAGALLFSGSGRARLAVTGRLVAGFVGVSVLHGLWDSMNDIAIMLTYVLSGRPWQYRLLELGWIPEPTPDQVLLFTGLSWAGLAGVALVGLLGLAWLLRGRVAARV